jgi:serine/threonine protein kinase
MRVIVEREISEVFFGMGEELGIPIGDGATFQVEKKRTYVSKIGMKWVAAKRAKVVVPKRFTAELSMNDETYRRLKAVLLEVEVLSHPRIRQHQNIAPLIGYTWDETASGYAPILVMELATFGDARKLLSSTKLSDEEKVALCGDIASGLEALHTCSIVHGDVKLENVLIYPGSSSRFTAKISDLERSPQSGDLYLYRGTKVYNAPEVQNAHTLNQPLLVSSTQLWLCDVFSFGLLTLEVLSNANWYGELPGGEMLAEKVLGSNIAGMSLPLQYKKIS